MGSIADLNCITTIHQDKHFILLTINNSIYIKYRCHTGIILYGGQDLG